MRGRNRRSTTSGTTMGMASRGSAQMGFVGLGEARIGWRGGFLLGKVCKA